MYFMQNSRNGEVTMNSTQMVEYRPSINEIIVVEQLPIIRQQLEIMRDSIKQDIDTALSLDVTEETVKEIKGIRSRLNNDYKVLEKARIEVKKKILSPYEKFEAIYKDCISSVYGPADEILKKKIADVEDRLKKTKQQEIEAYFSEYCLSKGIDFLGFHQAGVAITLTASKKSLKAQVAAFVNKVAEEIAFISTQEHTPEVLVEYKKSLNAVQAMTVVSNRHKALEAEQLRIEQARQREAQQAQVTQRVEQVLAEEMPPQAPAAPIAAPLPAPAVTLAPEVSGVTPEKILSAKFTVKGTKVQLLALRRFLLEGGYDFE